MMRRAASIIGGFLVFAGLTAGCSKAPVVGVLLPTTGAASTYGESIESGIRLAVSEAREKEVLPANFEVVWIDTKSDPATAVKAYEDVVANRGARIVIGGATSAEAKELLPALDKNNIICRIEFTGADNHAARAILAYVVEQAIPLLGFDVGECNESRMQELSAQYQKCFGAAPRSL